MSTPTASIATHVLQPAEGRTPVPLDILGTHTLIKLAGADTGNRAAVFLCTVPTLAGPPLHRHSREDEWFYVVSGEIVVQVDGVRHTLTPGCSAYAPRGTAHAFQNFQPQTAQLLVIATPADFDNFFRELDALNQGLPSPDFAGTERLMNQYGMELLGPPLA